MSLVNYSSDEEEEEEGKKKEDVVAAAVSASSSSVRELMKEQPDRKDPSYNSQETTTTRLPDAAELLSSFDSPMERLANIMPASRLKRPDLNGSEDTPRKKIPRGYLIPSRIVPDTAGGSLVPPQLRGRSNIATEDLERLFTRKS